METRKGVTDWKTGTGPKQKGGKRLLNNLLYKTLARKGKGEGGSFWSNVS